MIFLLLLRIDGRIYEKISKQKIKKGDTCIFRHPLSSIRQPELLFAGLLFFLRLELHDLYKLHVKHKGRESREIRTHIL